MAAADVGKWLQRARGRHFCCRTQHCRWGGATPYVTSLVQMHLARGRGCRLVVYYAVATFVVAATAWAARVLNFAALGAQNRSVGGRLHLGEARSATNYRVGLRPISRIVWQTWKTVELPPSVATARRAIMEQNPDYEFKLVDDYAAAQFMREHFRGPTLDAYLSINPKIGAMRADLWRYCVLYVHGGVYLDLDSTIRAPLREWVLEGDTAVLSNEGHQWSVAQQVSIVRIVRPSGGVLTDPLSFARLQQYYSVFRKRLPSIVAGDGQSFLQWMLIFSAGHPILAETIRHVTAGVLAWYESEPSSALTSCNRVCMQRLSILRICTGKTHQQLLALRQEISFFA
jgi:hypothetical protein